MDYQFTFTLKNEEYLSYVRHQVAGMKANRGQRLLLRTSIPALILCTIIVLELYQDWMWMCVALAIMILWILYGAPMLWRNAIAHRINESTLKKMNIQGFQEVTLHFLDDKLTYKDHKLHTITYEQISVFAPLSALFIFRYDRDGTILLPYRVFQDDAEKKEFLHKFEGCWSKHK